MFDGIVQWCLRFCFLSFYFRLDNFYCSVFKFVDFLANSSMLLNLPSNYYYFLIWLLYFQLKTFQLVLTIFMSANIRYLISIVLEVFFSSLKIFIIAD